MTSINTDVCGYKIQYDYTTSTPLHYVSLFLKYAIPKDFVWDQNLRKIIDCDTFTMLEYGGKALQEKETVYAGSSAEGLVIPDFQSKNGVIAADIDKLDIICNTMFFPLPYEHSEYSSVQVFEIQSIPDGPPNYAYLVPTESFKTARVLSGNPTKTKLLSNMLFKKNLMKDFQTRIPGTVHSLHGPAVTSELFITERDNVPVIGFPGWPPVARDWVMRTRKSGWPTQRMINKIRESGFYMAGVGRRGTPMEEFEWRFSFNTAEKILAHSFTREQRQVYVYMKLLRKFYLKEPGIFPSYWMKTLFFWICEKISSSQFRSQNIGQVILSVLDEIIHILATKELPNYFIPSVNMLLMTSRDHLITTLKQARHVKCNLVDFILHIDRQICFLGMNRAPHEKLTELLPECVTAMRLNPMDSKLFQSSLIKGLKRLLGYYLGKFRQVGIYPEDMFLERDAIRNVLVSQIREVLGDLRMLDESRDKADLLDMKYILEQSKDAAVLARVLAMLVINGNAAVIETAKPSLCLSIDRIVNSVNTETEKLTEVKTHILKMSRSDFSYLDNEIVYKVRSIYASGTIPIKLPAKEACKQM